MVSVDAAVFSFAGVRARLLLVRRGKEPYKGRWALPGGFLDMKEEPEETAARELREETGLTGVRLIQMQTFGRCGRDPRGRVITIVFTGVAEGGRVRGGDDAAEAKWFDIERLPKRLAFDHEQVSRAAIARLKRRKAYRERSAAR